MWATPARDESRAGDFVSRTSGFRLDAAPSTEVELQRVTAVVAAAGDRIKIAGDILSYPEFFAGDDARSRMTRRPSTSD